MFDLWVTRLEEVPGSSTLLKAMDCLSAHSTAICTLLDEEVEEIAPRLIEETSI